MFGKLFDRSKSGRERDFFKLLSNQSERTLAGMEALKSFMANESQQDAAKVLAVEHEADDARRTLIDELNRNFVTPIDREDIFALSRSIDDVVDYAKSTVDEMTTLGVHPNQYLQQIADILYQAASELNCAVANLKPKPQVAAECAVRAKKLENQIERIYHEAVADLFKNKLKSLDDVGNLLKLREIYRHLSNAADRGDEAADILCDIIVKMT